MVLFWHNHFVVSDLNDNRFYYRYINLLRENALGDFKQLTKDITVDPSMLRYLNGNQNTKNAPNENYARELLELFTIGKGPLAGPGDYTNYTEDDVRAMAKILTGWRDTGYSSLNNPTLGAAFTLGRHDTSTKTLSPRFNNESIANEGAEEYKTLVDTIFKQKEVARFISRKLYRWFVYYKIDETIEQEIIEPMAQLLTENNFKIRPVLSALLKSEHFYSECVIGVMIKNPLDFMAKLIQQYTIAFPADVATQYRLWLAISAYSEGLQMRPFLHPNVAGWSPFYQEPSYYQIWLNAVTMPMRHRLSDSITSQDTIVNNIRVDISLIPFIETLSDPYDINRILIDLNNLLIPAPFSPTQIEALKNIVLPGLPDYEWNLEYSMHKENPNDLQLKRALESKIRELLKYIMQMPEFQLS
jgi:uncharacterized protein (DUF1800 family)